MTPSRPAGGERGPKGGNRPSKGPSLPPTTPGFLPEARGSCSPLGRGRRGSSSSTWWPPLSGGRRGAFFGVEVPRSPTIGRSGASSVITGLALPVASPPQGDLVDLRARVGARPRGEERYRPLRTPPPKSPSSRTGAGPGPTDDREGASPATPSRGAGRPPCWGRARTSSPPATSLSSRRRRGGGRSAQRRLPRRGAFERPRRTHPAPGTPLSPAGRLEPRLEHRDVRHRPGRGALVVDGVEVAEVVRRAPSTEKSRASTSTPARTWCAPQRPRRPRRRRGSRAVRRRRGRRRVHRAWGPRRRRRPARHGLQEVRRGQRSTWPKRAAGAAPARARS
jgi:hypothetical protein